MTLKNRLALYFFLVIVALAIAIRAYNFFHKSEGYISFNGNAYPVLVADNYEKLYKGLGGLDNLGEYRGMYFIFFEPGRYTIVMRDMKFPLDIIWLNGKEVVGIKENAPLQPSADEEHLIKYINLSGPADAVLEAPAGFVKQNNIKPGSEIIFTKK